MASAPSPTSLLVGATLYEDDTLSRIIPDRPKADILTMAMMQAVAEALNAHRGDQQRRLVIIRGADSHFSFGASIEEHRRDQAPKVLANHILTSRDGGEGISAYLERRKPVWGDR